MIKIITIGNQKGGVAKTTTCINLGYSLALFKKKVLLIDLDPQANLSKLLKINDKNSIYEYLNDNIQSPEDIIIEINKRLFLLPSNLNLSLMNKEYYNKDNYEYILQNIISKIKNNYDFILIDTPPSIGWYTINAFTCSDLVIIPVVCDYLGTSTIRESIDFIKLAINNTNPGLIYNILITMYENNNISSVLLNKLINNYKKYILNIKILLDNNIKESQINHLTAYQYKKKSAGSIGYLHLAKNIILRNINDR